MLLATKLKYLRMTLVIAVLLSQAACGGKGKELASEEEGQFPTDITLPPQTIKGVTADEESNPDETISFEKWKKKQESDE